jgi:hypothetical protein
MPNLLPPRHISTLPQLTWYAIVMERWGHEGLHTQRGWSVPLGRAEAKREEMIGEGQRGQADNVLAAASNELFGPAIDA